MEQASSSRPRGRPSVPDAARKRNNVTIRMRDKLKSAVEQSAAAGQRSISEEIETRLEKSLAAEAQFGGPEMLAIVNLMAGAFLRGGQLGARARQHPEWSTAEWLADPFCYRAAAYAVADALNLPTPTSASTSDPAALHELLTGMVARGAPLTVKKGSDK
jgi:hypothetical protein